MQPNIEQNIEKIHTAAIISAISPFGYPFSEAEPDLRLISGAARPIINLESSRPSGYYIKQSMVVIY